MIIDDDDGWMVVVGNRVGRMVLCIPKYSF